MSSGSICTVNTAFSVTGPLHSLLCRSLGMDRCTLTLITSRPDLRRNAARVAVFQGADRSLDDDAPALLDLWPTRDYTDPRRAHRSIPWRNNRYASSRHYAAIRRATFNARWSLPHWTGSGLRHLHSLEMAFKSACHIEQRWL